MKLFPVPHPTKHRTEGQPPIATCRELREAKIPAPKKRKRLCNQTLSPILALSALFPQLLTPPQPSQQPHHQIILTLRLNIAPTAKWIGAGTAPRFPFSIHLGSECEKGN